MSGGDVEGARPVVVVRVPGECGEDRPTEDLVAVEEAVTLDVEGVGRFTLLCTPCDLEALALGFLFAEGLVEGASGVESCRLLPGTPWSSKVRIRLASPPKDGGGGRNLIVTSSCGACGSTTVVEAMQGPAVADGLRVPAAVVFAVAAGLRSRQGVFRATGGAHAAAVFSPDGEVVAVAEDVGRHNALDKAIGHCLLAGRSPTGLGVMMSGRLSFELVIKAARAGIQILAGVSAPSSLAVEAARARAVTLCGFVRDGRMNVYAEAQRIVRCGETPG